MVQTIGPGNVCLHLSAADTSVLLLENGSFVLLTPQFGAFFVSLFRRGTMASPPSAFLDTRLPKTGFAVVFHRSSPALPGLKTNLPAAPLLLPHQRWSPNPPAARSIHPQVEAVSARRRPPPSICCQLNAETLRISSTSHKELLFPSKRFRSFYGPAALK